MKAARLNSPGTPLVIEEVELPHLHLDSVIVKVFSSHMMSYTDEVLGGDGTRIPTPVPYTPGLSAVGLVEQVGEAVQTLQQGDLVFCNPHVVDHPVDRDPEQILIGWFGITPGAGYLLEKWKNGSFAEYAGYPAECVTKIDPSFQSQHATLAHLNILTVAYGALLKADWKPGNSLVINGITGNISASTALIALALGAEKVVGLGRDLKVLDQLKILDERLDCVVLSGELETDTTNLAQRIERADVCIDASAAPDSISTEVSLSALRHGGCAVWVGGVRANIPVSYFDVLIKELKIVGSYMYDPECPRDLVRMIESGVLDLSPVNTQIFGLEDVNLAIEQAPEFKGLSSVVIQP